MRLKTFTAPTTAEAMELVRRELGEQAIIVATQKSPDEGTVRLTAALEMADFEDEPPFAAEPEPVDVPETLRQALRFHDVPTPLTERLLRGLAHREGTDIVGTLAAALDRFFEFDPLPDPLGAAPPHRIMLIGPPGSGKTLTAAKLAARVAPTAPPALIVSTDTRRPGGPAHLQALVGDLGLDVNLADTPEALRTMLTDAPPGSGVIIDTPGSNPYGDGDMERLMALIRATDTAPTLVLGAGGDALEAADMAAAFARLGCERALFTRLDMTRRLGSLLTSTHGGGLKFSNLSTTPRADDGLSAVTPVALARLIVPQFHATQDHGPMIASVS
ncbi:AAA family ATPase [Magnetospira thiophila]